MQKADAAMRANTKVLKNNRLPWHVRKLTLTAAVQPVLTYACQVWNCCTAAQRRKLDGWQASVLKCMTHCPPTASNKCVQQELGILPLHMSCDLWQLTYWHKARTLTTDRLLHQVYAAWTGAHNPWLQNIRKLLAEYEVDEEATLTLSVGKFVALVRRQVAAKLSEVGPRDGGGMVATQYANHFGAGAVRHDKPVARAYISALSAHGRGPAAELCMRLRTQALQLRALHSGQRRNESAEAQRLRELCPCCQQAAETTHHFLLECPAYAEHRARMLEVIRAKQPQQHAAILAAVPPDGWRLLLSDAVLTNALPRRSRGGAAQPREQQQQQLQQTSAWAVAGFVVEAWKVRNTALTGRGANGGNAMA